MNTRRIHPVLCLMMLAAFLLPAGLATSGMMTCAAWAGNSLVEVVSEHQHCEAAARTTHNFEAGDCRCSVHPCRTKRVGVNVALRFGRDGVQIPGLDATTVAALARRFQQQWYFARRALLRDSRASALARLHGELRIIRLLV